jgi:hypothetical protein
MTPSTDDESRMCQPDPPSLIRPARRPRLVPTRPHAWLPAGRWSAVSPREAKPVASKLALLRRRGRGRRGLRQNGQRADRRFCEWRRDDRRRRHSRRARPGAPTAQGRTSSRAGAGSAGSSFRPAPGPGRTSSASPCFEGRSARIAGFRPSRPYVPRPAVVARRPVPSSRQRARVRACAAAPESRGALLRLTPASILARADNPRGVTECMSLFARP